MSKYCIGQSKFTCQNTCMLISNLTISHTTRFRVFGEGWVQSTTFLDSFSFHDYLGFIGLYASICIGDEETYKKVKFHTQCPSVHIFRILFKHVPLNLS